MVQPFPRDCFICFLEDVWSWHVPQRTSGEADASARCGDPCGSWQVVQSPLPRGPWTSFFASFRSWHW